MDIANTFQILRTKAELNGTRPAKIPLGGLILPGLLLLALQYDSSNPGSVNNPNTFVRAPAPVPAPDTTPDTVPLTSVERALVTVPKPIVTVSTDHLPGKTNRKADSASPLATSMSGARVALTSFTTTSITTAKTNYQFNQIIEQSLFTAVVSSPFAVGFDTEAKLGIWQTNSRFSLISKAHKFVIMLDPGHGGSDPGSVGPNGLQEKTLTLDIARRAKRLLSKNENVTVILTRNADKGMSRGNRVHKVMRSNADMFVSLHLNHLPQTDVNLVETFYAAPHNILESINKQRAAKSRSHLLDTSATIIPNLSFTSGSRQLASIMQNRVFDEVSNNNPDTDNAGVKEDTLYILTRSFTPGALIEISCLSNIKEAERLKNPSYREKLAIALADGIQDYLATPASKRQFGPEV